jgi:hypothetical protein
MTKAYAMDDGLPSAPDGDLVIWRYLPGEYFEPMFEHFSDHAAWVEPKGDRTRYQMLAYCRILNIPTGFLITAGDETGTVYKVHDGQTTIKVLPVDLSGTMREVDAAVMELGRQIVGS